MDNKFLADFLKMRKSLNAPVVKAKASPGLVKMPEPSNDMTLAYIISEKPSRKEVIEYFRNRVEELATEDD